jgi:hypothetical protein
MQETIKVAARTAAREVHEQPLEEFVMGRPAQMALLGLQFQWTADTQAALHAAARREKAALTKALKKAVSFSAANYRLNIQGLFDLYLLSLVSCPASLYLFIFASL